MADIVQIAEKLNSDVTRLNNERSKLEGMLESAKTNYEKAVKAYEVKYGVKLTEETLQQEYNEVFARTKGAILDLQDKIESIKRGDYKKDVEEVEYDLEPDVEPIRAEVEAKPEKKKRTRKKKEVVTESIEDVKAEDIEDVQPEPIVNTDVSTKDISADLPFDMGDFGMAAVENKVVETPIEVPTETPKISKGKGERKPLNAAALSAAVAGADSSKQHPVTLGVEDDEVDISGLGLENSFGSKPIIGKDPDSPIMSDFSFGGFGDLGTSEVSESPSVKEEPIKEENKEESFSFGGFGDLGGLGGFGGFGDLAETNNVSDDDTSDDEVEDVIPSEGFTFGGFGDLGTDPVEPKKEEKKAEPITPTGWGEFDFSGFGGFGDILGSGNTKFGE